MNHHMLTNRQIIMTIIIAIFVITIGYMYYRSAHRDQEIPEGDIPATVATTTPLTQTTIDGTASSTADVYYVCDARSTIHAVYFPTNVIIELSDGRAMQLPITAASSTKYANSDASFVFHGTSTSASFTEHGIVTYAGCAPVDTTDVEGPGAE